jgi:regulator of sirC expression with transglutaminase-like and TPR domain
VVLGATLIAKDVYDDLDLESIPRRFDELAGPLRGGALVGLPLGRQAERVSAEFRALGFSGNVAEYYDPKNSLLPDVLERRTGIPITLAIVWCEMARRAGVFARGIAFPGHFLVRVEERPALGGRTIGAPVIVDPFGDAQVVGDAELRALLRRTLGDGAELHPSLLEPASARTTLVRMLMNLKAIWANRGDHARAFVAIDRIVALVPDSARMLRERAGVALRLGIDELARADLARVLELEPQAPDARQIERRLAELRVADRAPPN